MRLKVIQWFNELNMSFNETEGHSVISQLSFATVLITFKLSVCSAIKLFDTLHCWNVLKIQLRQSKTEWGPEHLQCRINMIWTVSKLL